jgi:hypothetical protein
MSIREKLGLNKRFSDMTESEINNNIPFFETKVMDVYIKKFNLTNDSLPDLLLPHSQKEMTLAHDLLLDSIDSGIPVTKSLFDKYNLMWNNLDY